MGTGVDDTPFHIWLRHAVDEMEQAMDGQDCHVNRVHLFKCFQALVAVMEEVIKANK